MLITKIRKKMHIFIISSAVIFIVGFVIGDVILLRGPIEKNKRLLGKTLPEYVAIVEKNKITRGELWQQVINFLENFQHRNVSQKEIEALNSYALDMLINKYILLQEARERKIKVIIPEVNNKLRAIRDRMVGSSSRIVDASIPGRIKYFFEENKREKAFRDILGRRGISYSDFKKTIRNDLIVEKVSNHLIGELKNKEEERAKKRAEEVLNKLKSGTDFSTLVQQFSEDEGTKNNGGNLGWFKRGTMVKEFEEVAFKMPVGQISNLVKTKYGFHIIQVLARKDAYGEAFENEKEKIRNKILNKKLNEIKNSSENDQKAITVTDEEIKNEYEEINARHILIKIENPQILFNKWLLEKKKRKKIKILDPALIAYRYYNRIGEEYRGKEIDLDKAIKLYENVLTYTPENPYVLNKIGDIYLEKYEKNMEKVKSDPYQQIEENKKTKKISLSKENKLILDNALKMYNKALKVAEERNIYDGQFYYSRYRVYELLGNRKSSFAQLKKASEYAGNDISLRRKIKEGFEKLGKQQYVKKEEKEIESLEEKYRNQLDYEK